MQFLREEREERKYIHLLQRKDKKQKKKKSLHISHAHLPPPRNTTKKDGIRFTNQRRRGDKKEDRRPEEDHGQEGALASLSRGSFSDRIPIFFFRLSRPKWFCLLQREEKKRDQKTNQKSATFASSRLCAFAPKNRPFDAVKRAHRTPKCTGSTSVRALTPQHPSRAGREEVLSSYNSKNKSRKRFAKFLSSRTHLSHKNQRLWTMGKKRGRRDFVFGPILIFFLVVSPQKREKIHPNTDHIFFFFFHSNPKQRPLMGGSYLCIL